jgi:hypothetical protein
VVKRKDRAREREREREREMGGERGGGGGEIANLEKRCRRMRRYR